MIQNHLFNILARFYKGKRMGNDENISIIITIHWCSVYFTKMEELARINHISGDIRSHKTFPKAISSCYDRRRRTRKNVCNAFDKNAAFISFSFNAQVIISVKKKQKMKE